MQQKTTQPLPQTKLGNSPFSISTIGLGCMGMSAFYSQPLTQEQVNELVGIALSQGTNFFDTAYIYGENEKLLKGAIEKYGRDKFVIATKVPPMFPKEDGSFEPIPGTPENIKKYCQESLDRLGISKIDLYYQHRIDANIPIETQAQAFKDLVQDGKISHYGLSEASEDTIRRAHKVHPVSAVQEEYSLFTRDIETNGVLNTCKELGITLVAYSPIGRGLLTGVNYSASEADKGDLREAGLLPRFQEENLKKNQQVVDKLRAYAQNLNVTATQLALAWLFNKNSHVVPIPGTKREKYLTENNQAAFIKLTPQQVQEIDAIAPIGSIVGSRYAEAFMPTCNVTTKAL